MAWPMERPFYSEEVGQHDVGSKKEEVKKSQTTDKRKID
jgi:hypothetical protein